MLFRYVCTISLQLRGLVEFTHVDFGQLRRVDEGCFTYLFVFKRLFVLKMPF